MEKWMEPNVPENAGTKNPIRGKRLTRRTLLASIGMAGATLACGTLLRPNVSGAGAGASVFESVYKNPPTDSPPKEGAAYPPQVDFVRLLREHNETAATLYAKVSGNRALEVLIPFKGKWCAHYAFAKDPNDDFIKLMNGSVSVMTPVNPPPSAVHASKQFDVLHSWSNKEFAFSVTPAGSGLPSQWLPEHVNVGTVYAVAQRIYFDDAEIADWTPETSFRPVKSVKIVQRLLGRHPSDPGNPLAEITCVHTASASGVSVKSKVKWLRPVTISTGYGMMFPVPGSFAAKLLTGCGRSYDAVATDGSTTDLTENDQSSSYAYVHNSAGANGEPDTMVAMTIHDIANTFRQSMPGRRAAGSIVWLQHRDASMQKLYPQVFDRYTAAAGETYEAGGTYFIGELPLADRFFG